MFVYQLQGTNKTNNKQQTNNKQTNKQNNKQIKQNNNNKQTNNNNNNNIYCALWELTNYIYYNKIDRIRLDF